MRLPVWSQRVKEGLINLDLPAVQGCAAKIDDLKSLIL
jgi:hypothetical protein